MPEPGRIMLKTTDEKEVEEFWEENEERIRELIEHAVKNRHPLIFASIDKDEGARIAITDCKLAMVMIDQIIQNYDLAEQTWIIYQIFERLRYRQTAESVLHVLKQLGIMEYKEGE